MELQKITPKTQATSSRVIAKEFTLVSLQFSAKIADFSVLREKQLLYASKRHRKVYVKDLVTSGGLETTSNISK
jgi:hypothetical protein